MPTTQSPSRHISTVTGRSLATRSAKPIISPPSTRIRLGRPSARRITSSHILGANFFGPHRSAALYGNPDYIPGEEAHVERLAYSAIDSANVVAAGSREEMADYLAHPAVNHPKAREWVHDVHAIFPNHHIDTGQRSEERSVGKKRVGKCRNRWR